MTRNPWRSGLWTAAVVVAMAAFWLTFAPTVAGGQSIYVIVAGASMEPTLSRGDLVIARPAPAYQVGDIVTYRHPTVGPVIHRIIEAQDATYTLQGDANAWTDSYHPTSAEILGKSWLQLPRVGMVLTWLRLPPVLGLLALVISILVVATIWPARETEPAPGGRGRVVARLGGWMESASTMQFTIFLLGLMILLGALLAVPSWTRPLTRAAERVFPYAHAGTFHYGARVPDEVYGESELQTGQPAYLNLTRRLSVDFTYTFTSDSPVSISGTTALAVEVSDINGWSRRVILQAPKPFEGTTAQAAGVLDLSLISGYLRALEERTGVTRPYYTVAVQPIVQAQGVVAGLPLATTFEPELTFLIDELQFQLAPQDPTQDEGDPLAPRQDGAVETTEPTDNHLTILGIAVAVRAGRWISGILLSLGLGGLALLAWFYLRSVRRDPLVAIRLKYGAQLVALQPGALEIGAAMIEVAGLDDLARVAEKHGRLMQWTAAAEGYVFMVLTGEGVYAHHLTRPPEAPAQTADREAPAAGGEHGEGTG